MSSEGVAIPLYTISNKNRGANRKRGTQLIHSQKIVTDPRVVECVWLNPAPIAAPMCIIGPSGPTGRPDVTAKQVDRNLTKKVTTLNTCGTADQTNTEAKQEKPVFL